MIVIVFRGLSYHGFIVNLMEPFEFISSLSNNTFDLIETLCFRGSNYFGLIVSSMETFELI
jgi:hypothetical protein